MCAHGGGLFQHTDGFLGRQLLESYRAGEPGGPGTDDRNFVLHDITLAFAHRLHPRVLGGTSEPVSRKKGRVVHHKPPPEAAIQGPPAGGVNPTGGQAMRGLPYDCRFTQWDHHVDRPRTPATRMANGIWAWLGRDAPF